MYNKERLVLQGSSTAGDEFVRKPAQNVKDHVGLIPDKTVKSV
jgi:hypothetical protein